MSRPAYSWTPELDRQLLALRAEGLTAREIAERVGRTHDAVRIRFSRKLGRASEEPEGAVVCERECLRCSRPMRSTGPHHRLCDPCRIGNGLPAQWQIAR